MIRKKTPHSEKGTIRQKIIHCGKGIKTRYREIDIYYYKKTAKSRGDRKNKSRPEQEKLNDKNARRYINQLVKANFFTEDYRVDLTYDDEHLPKNEEEANKLVHNFLKKIKRERAKLGLGPVKYIWINEGFDGERRPHHHLLLNGGLSRDTIEGMWVKGRGKNKKTIGYTCVERLRFNSEGIVGLVKYITKQVLKEENRKAGATEGQLTLADASDGDITMADLLGDGVPGGKKRWKQSKNLVKPHERTKDRAYSNKEIRKIVSCPPDCEDTKRLFESRYPGYALDTCRFEHNEVTGLWSIYLTMHRKEDG